MAVSKTSLRKKVHTDNGWHALRSVGLWVFLLTASFLVGALVISPLLNATVGSNIRPKLPAPAKPSESPGAASAVGVSRRQVANAVPPVRAAPNVAPSISIEPDRSDENQTQTNDVAEMDSVRSEPLVGERSAPERRAAAASGSSGLVTGANGSANRTDETSRERPRASESRREERTHGEQGQDRPVEPSMRPSARRRLAESPVRPRIQAVQSGERVD